MVAEVFERMEFVDLTRFASGTGMFRDIARLVLNLRYNRMLERFYPSGVELRKKLDETCSAISGSFVLEYALYGLLWKCNDLDIYTLQDRADEWEEFFKRVGYVRQTRQSTDEDGGGEPYFIPTVKEVRTLVRTRHDGRRSLVDIIVSDSANVLRPLSAFWNTFVQNFATGNTFTFVYPRNTFALRGQVTGMWRQDDRVPEMVQKYLSRGFISASPNSTPIPPQDFPPIRRNLFDAFSWSINISNGNAGDEFSREDVTSLIPHQFGWFDGGVLLF